MVAIEQISTSRHLSAHLKHKLYATKPYVLAGNCVDNIIWRGSEELRDDRKLVDMIFSWEKRLALQHLCENTARAPDIYLHIILLPCKHDLRRSVVSCRHISGHLGILQTGKAEVADLEIAVLVYENVTGLEIAMDDTCGVDILETALNEVSIFGAGKEARIVFTRIW